MPQDILRETDFLYEKDGPVTTITFNRPERRNCMTRDLMLDFEKLVRKVRDDRDTRVLIITGTGPAFSAGADTSATKGIADRNEQLRLFVERNRGLPRIIGRVFDQITRLDCMAIAAVNGYAVGGGWALALACDFVLAAEEAEFWVPEVDFGVAFTGGPGLVMTQRMGSWRAKEAIIMCRRYKASELMPMGMVNQVVEKEGLMPAARQLAAELLKKPRKAATASKHFIDGLFVGPRLY